MIPASRLINEASVLDRITQRTAALGPTAVRGGAQVTIRRRAVRKTWLTAVAWLRRDVSDELPF